MLKDILNKEAIASHFAQLPLYLPVRFYRSTEIDYKIQAVPL
jgi:hypothetical protein